MIYVKIILQIKNRGGFLMNYLTPDQIIRIQSMVENEQNNFLNENSLYSITAKFHQGYYDDCSALDVLIDYFESLINKHIFANGNKRTAIVSSIIFMEMNGYKINCSEDTLYEAILSYFENKNTDKIKSCFENNLEIRNYHNSFISSFNYHLNNVLNKYSNLIEKLSFI
jgi:death-on-curing protein